MSKVDVRDIAAIGITNQRETTLLWEKDTGRCVHNAIVWQCRRTAPYVERLLREGYGETIRKKTGLVPDAYFSGTKLAWLLDTLNLHERAEKGELCFGTVDSFLAWHLVEGRPHVTDATNAGRTMLFTKKSPEISTSPSTASAAAESSSTIFRMAASTRSKDTTNRMAENSEFTGVTIRVRAMIFCPPDIPT